jgi:hypothetical protein
MCSEDSASFAIQLTIDLADPFQSVRLMLKWKDDNVRDDTRQPWGEIPLNSKGDVLHSLHHRSASP